MLAPDARDVLELSRNKLTRAGERTLHQRLNEAMKVAVPRWLEHWRGKSEGAEREMVQRLSLYAYLWEPTVAPVVIGDEWKEVILGGTQSVTLGQVATAQKASFSMESSVRFLRGSLAAPEPADIRIDGDRVILRRVNGDTGIERWLQAFLFRQFRNRILDADEREIVYHFVRADSDVEDVTDAGLGAILRMRSPYFGGIRSTIPCPKAFSELRLRDGVQLFELVQNPFVRRTMANPFVRRERPPVGVELLHVESYARWVAKQAGSPLRYIVKALLDFIRHVDALMGEKGWLVPKRYSVADAELRLSQALEQEARGS
jgi:hypothetical protein